MYTTCIRCKRYVALLPTERGNIYRAVDLQDDGYTATDHTHACNESDWRAL